MFIEVDASFLIRIYRFLTYTVWYLKTSSSLINTNLNADMGSRCSILNDTEHDVWITHGINWTVFKAAVGTVLALLAVLASLASAGAALGVGGVLLGGGAAIMGEEGIIMGTTARTIAGLTATQWRGITSLSSALSTVLQNSMGNAEQLQVRNFQNNARLIRPGERYTWSGTLSLTKTVYVLNLNDRVQINQRACFTGPTHGSENVYPISEYFQ